MCQGKLSSFRCHVYQKKPAVKHWDNDGTSESTLRTLRRRMLRDACQEAKVKLILSEFPETIWQKPIYFKDLSKMFPIWMIANHFLEKILLLNYLSLWFYYLDLHQHHSVNYRPFKLTAVNVKFWIVSILKNITSSQFSHPGGLHPTSPSGYRSTIDKHGPWEWGRR